MLAEDSQDQDSVSKEQLASIRDQIEQTLESFLESKIQDLDLAEAVRYTTLSPGKRIRPLLVLALATDLGLNYKHLLQAALSIELVHASSLIHDDLPALDNDDYRRCKPACHKAFTEATAILTGDYLNTLAFAAISESPLPDDVKVKAISMLSAAYCAVCEGQQRDITPAGREVAEIHQLKTASLFQAATTMAALAIREEGILAKTEELGLQIGLYFQAYNDLLDIYGSDEQRGRPNSSDERNEKETLYTNETLANARKHLDTIRSKLTHAVAELEQYKLEGDSRRLTLTRALISLVDEKVAAIGTDASPS